MHAYEMYSTISALRPTQAPLRSAACPNTSDHVRQFGHISSSVKLNAPPK
jgi:hypothetical protein